MICVGTGRHKRQADISLLFEYINIFNWSQCVSAALFCSNCVRLQPEACCVYQENN